MTNQSKSAFTLCPLFTQAIDSSDVLAAAQRLWRKDASLWPGNEEIQAKIANRLGWLHSAQWVLDDWPAIAQLAKDVKADGLTDIVLLGMGGSSLAPEVINALADGSRLTVLDNTSVAAVSRVRAQSDPASTAYIVSSKSGGTIETMAFAHYFLHEVGQLDGATATTIGKHFVAITDPGSPLQSFAREREFRHVFENPADIGGRYSALSYFGVVPPALAGIDMEQQLLNAVATQTQAAQGEDLNGAKLGCALGYLATKGRDKLTLVFSESLRPMGAWIEQLVAESTGKEGKGIVPVLADELHEPKHYGADRVFVYTHTANEPLPQASLEALRNAGHPVLMWMLPSEDHLGAAFLDWEIATAISAVALAVNPFDEPNVTESKLATQTVLNASSDNAQAQSAIQALDINDLAPLRDALTKLLADTGQGDYIGVLAYLDVDTAMQKQLDAISHYLATHAKVPVTIGIGPRFLHSTGQLHKGGANNGVFIQLTMQTSNDIDIPTMDFGFATLNQAQAQGDLNVLHKRDRRTLAINLGPDPTQGLTQLNTLVADLS